MPTKDIVEKIGLGGKGIPKTKPGEVNVSKGEKTKDTVVKLGSFARFRKAIGANGNGDTAKKLARIAAIKKAALNNKKYNVRTSTVPVDPSSTSPVTPILYGGTGGGGYYGSAEMLEGGGFSLSDIPSIVWILLAVGVGWFLIASSGGKGKGKGKGSLF